MRFYTRQHRHYCGIDLDVKTMYVCILDGAGEVLVHRNVPSTPEALLATVAPYREDLVVAAECMFTWYWLADVCAAEGIPFVLGHALAMKAIHGGKAKTAAIDSRKLAGRSGAAVAAVLRLPGGDARDAGSPRRRCIWCASAGSWWRTSRTRGISIRCRPSSGRSSMRQTAPGWPRAFPTRACARASNSMRRCWTSTTSCSATSNGRSSASPSGTTPTPSTSCTRSRASATCWH